MAEHELSILVRAKGAVQAARDIGKVDSAVGRLSGHAARGVRTATRNVALIGVGAALAVGTAAKSGIESLAELEDATTAVSGAIGQMGKAGKVSASQIATWANEIEASVDAAFDDKEIVAATATLLRFGKVTSANVRPAMHVITDLAVKTGDVGSAASLLAKALADPRKAAGKLARSGVILTKVEQDQIATFVKAGKTTAAQRVILDALTASTKGAAKASAGPYRDSLNILADVSEDAQRALGEGFLPVIQKVSKLLSGELAKPSTIKNIREFGQGIASGLDSAISIARNLPWGAMGDALKVAGAGGKALLGAFQAMPPWVQTAVLTGWGLNKLTGGALGGIVGELGKGLIKGVLGMNAGVVNIKAGAVTGAGGGVAGAAGKGAGGFLSGVAKVFIAGAAIGVLTELVGIRGQQSTENRAGAAALTTKTNEFVKVAGVPEMQSSLKGILEYDRKLSASTDILNAEVLAFQMNIDGVRDAVREQEARLTQAIDADRTAVENMKGQVQTSLALTTAASKAAGVGAALATAISAMQIVAAIRANKTTVTVSPTTVVRTTVVQERTGSSSGSRNSGGGMGGH